MKQQNAPLIYVILAAAVVLSACNAVPQTSTTIADTTTTLSIRPTRPPNTIATATAIASDGTVWYAFDEFDGMGGAYPYSQNRGLYRSRDNVIAHFEITQTIRTLEMAPDGSLYVGAGCGVLRYHADKWETLANPDCAQSAFTKPIFPFDIAFAENGEVWVGGVHALVRFDGQHWTEYDIMARRVLVAPDGSLWADGWNGIANNDCCFTHITGDTWVTYTHSADLPVTADLARSIHSLRQ